MQDMHFGLKFGVKVPRRGMHILHTNIAITHWTPMTIKRMLPPETMIGHYSSGTLAGAMICRVVVYWIIAQRAKLTPGMLIWLGGFAEHRRLGLR
jgi:Mg/Co/Ni transporter MgtE